MVLLMHNSLDDVTGTGNHGIKYSVELKVDGHSVRDMSKLLKLIAVDWIYQWGMIQPKLSICLTHWNQWHLKVLNCVCIVFLLRN